MLLLGLLAMGFAASPCVRELARSTVPPIDLRGHAYAPLGSCGSLSVYRTHHTDSMPEDRRAAKRALVLVTGDPATALLYPYPGTAAQAHEAAAAVLGALGIEAEVELEASSGHTLVVLTAPMRDETLWAVLSGLAAAGGETVTQALYDRAAADIFVELARHGVTQGDGEPITAESIGQPVTVQGFARNSRSGAIVVRAHTLARCDVADHWPEDTVNQFITATGTLAWLPVEHRADFRPDTDFYETAVLQLQNCSVAVGPRAQDVSPEQWEALRGAGVQANLGETLVLKGVAYPIRGGSAVRVGAISLRMEGCVGEGPLMVRGELGYAMPYLLPGVGYRRPLVPTPTGWPDSFTLEDCVVLTP